ncbi:MAG: DUF7793 family protein [Bacteroidia bacterium]
MFKHEKFEITTIVNTIYKVRPVEGVELTEEDIREMRKVYLDLSKGKKFAILLDATGVFSVTDAARKLIASKEYTDKRFAIAFVTTSLANKIVGNFFIKFNKPASATKLFSDEETALEWIIEQEKNLGVK